MFYIQQKVGSTNRKSYTVVVITNTPRADHHRLHNMILSSRPLHNKNRAFGIVSAVIADTSQQSPARNLQKFCVNAQTKAQFNPVRE